MKSKLPPVILLIIIFAVYTPHLSKTIHYDEAITFFTYSRLNVFRIFISYTAPNNHLLHSVAVKIATGLIGNSLIGIRFPALTFALLSLAMIYRLGSRMHSQQVGQIALLLLALNPMFAKYMIEARGYSMGIFVSLKLTEMILFPGKSGRKRNYQLVLLSAMLLLILPTMLLFNAGVIAWCIFNRHRLRGNWLDIIPLSVGTIAGATVYLPALYLGLIQDHVRTYGESLIPLLTGIVKMLFLSLPALPMLIGLVIYSLLPDRKSLSGSFVSFIVTLILIITVVQSIMLGSVGFVRNYLYLVALLAPLAAIGLQRVLRYAVSPAYILLCILLILSSLTLGDDPDVLNVIDFVKSQDQTASILISCCTDEPVKYYMGNDPRLGLRNGSEEILIVSEQDRYIEIIAPYLLEDVIQVDTCIAEKWRTLLINHCDPIRAE